MHAIAMRTGLVSSPPDLSHTDLGQNIPDDPTERVEKVLGGGAGKRGWVLAVFRFTFNYLVQ